MRIAVFGTEKCKFCKYQTKHLDKTFERDDWVYLDLIKQKEMLHLAQDLDLENVPAIILFDENAKEFFRTEGTLPPDQIFHKLYKGAALPFSDQDVSKLKNKKGTILMSFDPKYSRSESTVASDYSNKKICNINVISSRKLSKKDIIENFGQKEYDSYLERGGREDSAWAVKFIVT